MKQVKVPKQGLKNDDFPHKGIPSQGDMYQAYCYAFQHIDLSNKTLNYCEKVVVQCYICTCTLPYAYSCQN